MYLTVFDEHILILFYQFHPGNRGLMNKTVITGICISKTVILKEFNYAATTKKTGRWPFLRPTII